MSTIQSFDFNVDLLRAILWQYNDATKLQSLLQSKQDWYNVNQSEFWSNWYRDVFNLETANEFGLAIWSIILNLPLYVKPPTITAKKDFGFGSVNFNFEHGNFSEGGSAVNFTLEAARLALQLRYHQMTCSGTVPETNRMLARVFGKYGRVHLLDGENMTQVYVFGFTPSFDVKYILDNLDVLPRPAGVKSSYIVSTNKAFGFGQYRVNFDNGNFAR